MKEATKAQQQFLQAQIKPHFIYNSLNVIIPIYRINPIRGEQLLDELSNYLRGKFTLPDLEDLIPLKRELDIVKSYLTIEQARFEERLKIIYQLQGGIEVLIPPLTLQPIVENAVKHGVCNKREGGSVAISVKKEEDFVVITVCDDGIGMSPEKLDSLLTKEGQQSGIGIRNVHMRLKNIFGEGLSIKSELGKGTLVIFRIPLGRIGKLYN